MERNVELMYKDINRDIDPTTDFIGYARGNFRAENYDVTKGEYLPVLNGDSFENIILNETITYPSLLKARDYRKSHVKEFKHLLKNKQLHEICGTFPAFDENWNGDNFDWIKASAILSAMHFRINFSFGTDYVEHGKSITLSIIGPDETPISNAREVLSEIGISDEMISDIINDVTVIREKFDEITTNDGYPLFEKLQTTYKELKQEYRKFLEFALSEPIDDDDIIYINNLEPGYFDKFLKIFQEAGPRANANYITYKFAYQLENDYYSSAVVRKHFAPVIPAAGFAAFWSEEIIRRREAVIRILKNSLEEIKSNFKRDPIQKLDSFLFNEREVKDFVEENYNLEEIEKEYENIEIDPENFFQNFLNTRKHGLTASIKRFIIMDGNEKRNAFLLLDFLIQNGNRPMYFYFAGWVLETWNDIIFECRFDEESEEYKSLFSRINEQIDKYKLPKGIVNNDFWVKLCLSKIAALKLAFENYKTWLNNNPTEAAQEGELLQKFNLSCSQAFFISYVQHNCWSEGVRLNSVFLALLNSEEFADTFECKPDSQMTIKDKIVIRWNKNENC